MGTIEKIAREIASQLEAAFVLVGSDSIDVLSEIRDGVSCWTVFLATRSTQRDSAQLLKDDVEELVLEAIDSYVPEGHQTDAAMFIEAKRLTRTQHGNGGDVWLLVVTASLECDLDNHDQIEGHLKLGHSLEPCGDGLMCSVDGEVMPDRIGYLEAIGK